MAFTLIGISSTPLMNFLDIENRNFIPIWQHWVLVAPRQRGTLLKSMEFWLFRGLHRSRHRYYLACCFQCLLISQMSELPIIRVNNTQMYAYTFIHLLVDSVLFSCLIYGEEHCKPGSTNISSSAFVSCWYIHRIIMSWKAWKFSLWYF